MVFPGVGGHQCTGEVMVRAYSHVLQPWSGEESTEPKQVYGVC
jgi:hypothetical protein